MYDGHGHSVGCSMRIYKQNERHLASVLLLNFPDFAFKDKAENAFFMPGISPQDSAKIAFFRHKTTLFVGFCFSDCKNNKNNKFCRCRNSHTARQIIHKKDVWSIKYFRQKTFCLGQSVKLADIKQAQVGLHASLDYSLVAHFQIKVYDAELVGEGIHQGEQTW